MLCKAPSLNFTSKNVRLYEWLAQNIPSVMLLLTGRMSVDLHSKVRYFKEIVMHLKYHCPIGTSRKNTSEAEASEVYFTRNFKYLKCFVFICLVQKLCPELR